MVGCRPSGRTRMGRFAGIGLSRHESSSSARRLICDGLTPLWPGNFTLFVKTILPQSAQSSDTEFTESNLLSCSVDSVSGLRVLCGPCLGIYSGVNFGLER